MKKLLNIGFLGALFVSLLIVGCNDDEGLENPPSLTLSSPNLVDGIYTMGDDGKVEISVSVNAINGFNVLRISFEDINLNTEEIIRTEDGQTTLDIDFTLENVEFQNESFSITFQAVDDTDQTAEQVVTVQPDLPTIELTSDNQDIFDGTLVAFAGSPYQIRYEYSFPGGFGQFKTILTIGSNSSESVVTELPPTQGLSVISELVNTLGTDALDMDISYTFEITDAQGNMASIELPVNLTQQPAKIYTAVLLAAPTFDESSQTFFSTNIGITYSVQDVNSSTENLSKEIDFGYYYGVNDMASLAGPANFPTAIYDLGPNGENWFTLNVTNFKSTTMTESQFNELNENSQAEIDVAYDDNTAEARPIITNIQVGDIISFKTDMKNNKNPRGLIKVVDIVGTDGSDARIEIEVITNQ